MAKSIGLHKSLSIKFSKTSFVIFQANQGTTIKINKKVISEEKYVKYLGVLADSLLRYGRLVLII